MRLGERTAENRKVLGENIDDAAIYGAPAGDDAITRDMRLVHTEVRAAVLLEHVEFLEGPFVQQDVDPLTRRQLAAPVLGVNAALPAPSRAVSRRCSSSARISFIIRLFRKILLPKDLARPDRKREVSTKKDLGRRGDEDLHNF